MINASHRSRLVSYPIRDIVAEAKALEKAGKNMIYLNIGDPGPFGFDPPRHVLDAIKIAIDGDYSAYAPSEGDPQLREVVARVEGVEKEDVFITAGLSEGIDFLFQALVDGGDNILLPSPSYPLYTTKSRVLFGTDNFYDCEESWEPDLEDVRRKINPFTRAIVVINPNNPTGAVYSRKTLEGIRDIAGEYDIPIIADNAYEMLIFDGEGVGIKDIAKDVPIVIGNSLSKNYIYPGARVGYIAFRGEGWGEIKDAVRRLANQRLSINWEMQRGAIAALEGSKEHIRQFNQVLKTRRDLLVKRVNEIDGLELKPPKGAFYAFVEITKGRWRSDWDFVRTVLRETGVVLVPGSGFSPILKKKYFRIVFLPPIEKLGEAMDRLAEFMKKY